MKKWGGDGGVDVLIPLTGEAPEAMADIQSSMNWIDQRKEQSRSISRQEKSSGISIDVRRPNLLELERMPPLAL